MQKLLKNFVPVTDECWHLDHDNKPGARFFREFGKQVPPNEWRAGKLTKQGIYAMTVDGTYLAASKSGTRKDVTIRVMQRALKKWGEIAKQKNYKPKPIPGRVANRTWGDRADKAGLLLQAHSRDLPRGKDLHPGQGWQKNAWNIVWLEYDKSEVAGFIPRGATKAKVPDNMVRKLVRKCLIDNVRGQTGEWRDNEIQKAWMNTELIQAKNGYVTVRLTGEAAAKGRGRGVEFKLHGRAIYNSQAARFIHVEMIAAGLRWGRTTFNFRKGETDATPIGVSFTLEDQYDRELPTACRIMPKKRVSSFSTARRTKVQKARDKPKKINPQALAAKERALQVRITEAIRAGKTLGFYYKRFRTRARIVSLDADGGLVMDCKGVEMTVPWSKLNLKERATLAQAVLRDGVAEDHCLVAFYCFATGETARAERHLAEGQACAEGVRAVFP